MQRVLVSVGLRDRGLINSLVTTTYGDVSMAAVKAKCWMVLITMVRIIWRDIRKVRVEVETAYGYDNPSVMVGQYLWGTLQSHRLMYDLLRTQFHQHIEIALHITLY